MTRSHYQDARLLSGLSVMMAVVEAGSFVRAADVLGLTPSGVSRAIARLETRIGIRLFDRNPRAVVLTEEGRCFHAQVAPLLTGIQEAAEEAAGASATVRGRLKLNLDPWFARIVLSPRLPELTTRYPQLSLELLVSNHREDMMAGGVDLALRFGPPHVSALIARKILETRIIPCASPSYLAGRGTPKVPKDVANHEALLFRDPHVTGVAQWDATLRAFISNDVKRTPYAALIMAVIWPREASLLKACGALVHSWKGVITRTDAMLAALGAIACPESPLLERLAVEIAVELCGWDLAGVADQVAHRVHNRTELFLVPSQKTHRSQ
jgi:DNA-binding transcriptional LysR family regulator